MRVIQRTQVPSDVCKVNRKIQFENLSSLVRKCTFPLCSHLSKCQAISNDSPHTDVDLKLKVLTVVIYTNYDIYIYIYIL